MNTSQIGNIGEARVLAEFIRYNIPCYIPYGDGCMCDLIAEFNDKLNKIQVKTTIAPDKTNAMVWKLTRQNGYHGKEIQYPLSQIDFFALYCITTDIVCLIPYNEEFPKSTISIRVDREQLKINNPNIRYASDYQISNIVENGTIF